jgi:hypothetical protein
MAEDKKKKIGIELTCQRKSPKCGYKWNYKGKSEWYTSCPMCKSMVNVRKRKIELGLIVPE